MENLVEYICNNCYNKNYVSSCMECDRYFILTESHLRGEIRKFEDVGLLEKPYGFNKILCDFCNYRIQGNLMNAIDSGLRQKTCPKCKTECLSGFKINTKTEK